MRENRLTDKQRKWIDYYKQGCTPGEAAKRAGYNANSQHSFDNIGSENVKKLGKYIADRETVLDSSRIADMNDINKFWTSVMNDPKESTKNRLKASELRARAAGGFIDRTSMQITGGGVVFISGDENIAE